MKRLLPLAIVLGLAGCSNSPGPSTVENTPTSTTSATTAGSTTGTPPPTIAADINPNRTNQLKDLAKIDLKVGSEVVHAWLMDTESKRQEGMMFLTDKDVADDQGMLFVFKEPEADKEHGFWMHNTLIPLDIVYLSPKGQVLNVAHGKVKDDTSLPPSGTYQYVLEVKDGLTAKWGLKPGDTIVIPSGVKATE